MKEIRQPVSAFIIQSIKMFMFLHAIVLYVLRIIKFFHRIDQHTIKTAKHANKRPDEKTFLVSSTTKPAFQIVRFEMFSINNASVNQLIINRYLLFQQQPVNLWDVQVSSNNKSMCC